MKKGHAAVFLFQASSNTTQAKAKGDASLQQDNRVLVLIDQSTQRNDSYFLFCRCLPFMGSDKSVMTRTMRSFVHEKEQRLKPVSRLLKPLLVHHAGQPRSRLTCNSPPSSRPSLSSSLASSSASLPASNWVVQSSVGHIAILPFFIFSLLRKLSRALLLWESEQSWCSEGKGEQSSQI